MEEKTIGNVTNSFTDPITGKFVKGNPGGGHPKGQKNFTTKVRTALEKIAEGKDYTYEEAFIKSILKKAIVDQDPVIMRLIWNYLDGMPHQSTDITTGGKPLPILGGISVNEIPKDNSSSEDSEVKEAS